MTLWQDITYLRSGGCIQSRQRLHFLLVDLDLHLNTWEFHWDRFVSTSFFLQVVLVKGGFLWIDAREKFLL